MTSATDPVPPTSAAPGSHPPTDEAHTREKAPRWSLPALIAILILAAALYTWNFSATGLNSFYSAAVLSGTESWKAWFFGSLDAGNFITVDKPPVELMVMGLSCRVFGYGTWQMMLPLVAAALGTIWILHTSVRRVFGYGAAAVAALVLALTPVTVAIDRDNNPDTLLVLLMVAGAALALRAVSGGKLLPLLGSATCFGFAFNTKLLEGWIVLPAVFAVYLYAAKPPLAKRIVNLLLAGLALAVSSFWWAAVVSLVPAADRPYIGGSSDGTAWDLIFGYNGLGRVLGGDGNLAGGTTGSLSGAAGLFRMFNDSLGSQISWLLPFAGVALAGGLVLRGRLPRTDVTRAALILWGGWTALTYLTFSFSKGTMHPYYTTALAPGIAALCGGGGAMLLRAFRKDTRWAWVLPAGLAATGIWAVVLLRRESGWAPWLWPLIAVVMALAIAGLIVFRSVHSGRRERLLLTSVIVAIIASVAGPAAYAADTVANASKAAGGNPIAGPISGTGSGTFASAAMAAGGGAAPGGAVPGGAAPGGSTGTGAPPFAAGGAGGAGTAPGAAGGQAGTSPGAAGGASAAPSGTGTVDTQLLSYLEEHRDGATWLVAVSDSSNASQLILASGQPVLSMWGFDGTDNAMTLDKLKELVSDGSLHYIQLGGRTGSATGTTNSLSTEVTAWVQQNGTPVPSSDYDTSPAAGSTSSSQSGTDSGTQPAATLYRLDPSDVG
jgi:4-amino-4-deoxy-L-arabinose transferase-like glycosyltransferase